MRAVSTLEERNWMIGCFPITISNALPSGARLFVRPPDEPIFSESGLLGYYGQHPERLIIVGGDNFRIPVSALPSMPFQPKTSSADALCGGENG